MKNRTLFFTTLVITLSLFASACTPFGQSTPASKPTTPSKTTVNEQSALNEQSVTSSQSATINSDGTTTLTANSTIELTATNPKKGETALDLLKNSGAKVEMKSYGDMGSFITSVNGIAGDAENYWAFYVNGQYAQQAADKTMLKPGDKVKFVYEKVSTAPVQ